MEYKEKKFELFNENIYIVSHDVAIYKYSFVEQNFGLSSKYEIKGSDIDFDIFNIFINFDGVFIRGNAIFRLIYDD